jgi:hypothetical protein
LYIFVVVVVVDVSANLIKLLFIVKKLCEKQSILTKKTVIVLLIQLKNSLKGNLKKEK